MIYADDPALVQACITGHSVACKAFYDRFKGKMFAMCLRYANNRAHAEDMLQDGFVKVFSDLHQFRNEGSLEGWVRRVILHIIFRDLRKHQNQVQVALDDEKYYLPETDHDDFAQRTAKELIQMMQNLAPGFRMVLNMYIFEGYTHKEIGEILGISEGTSKSQYMRAKIALRELYEQKLQ